MQSWVQMLGRMAHSTRSMNDTYNFYAYDCDHHSRKWEQSQQKYKFEQALSKVLPMGLSKGAWEQSVGNNIDKKHGLKWT